VDLSIWYFQAVNIAATRRIWTQSACTARVLLDRVRCWLSFGLLPVGICDGLAPPEKRGTQYARNSVARPEERAERARRRAETGDGNHHAAMYAIFTSLGLPVFRAAGEAEALAAQLDERRHCSGVATTDCDALLWGARTVFRTLHLNPADLKKSQLDFVESATITADLDIHPDRFQEATLMVALLVGGDYGEGVPGVTPALAYSAARRLLRIPRQGEMHRASVEELLRAELRAPLPLRSAPLACTRCRRCGHDGGQQTTVDEHTAANQCPLCPLTPTGRCVSQLAAPVGSNGGCICKFCRDPDDAALRQVVVKARASPGFTARSRTASNVYREQRQLAIAAATAIAAGLDLAPGQQLTWLRRPDAPLLRAVLCEAGLMGPGLHQWKEHQFTDCIDTMQQVYDGYQAEYGDPASQGDQAAGGSEAPPDPLAPEAAQCQPAGFTAAQPQGTDARTWWRSWAARAAATPFLPTGLVQALSTTAATTAASTADTAKGTAKEIASFKPISVMGEWFYCGGDSSDWDGLLD